jgi:hypothetical protein
LITDSNRLVDLTGAPISSGLPTRVITYAWGEHYLDILLSLTIPALLAPGNLPYVAASTSCELVILTEERFFPAVAAHSSIMRAKQLCPVRLIALDDLIAEKDKYGMALTHALHRGFSDLGPAMTQSWQLFLNADFVLAEGSLRSVISRLAQGARLVASPSYCVDAAAVIPKLREWTRMGSGSLSVPPRTLATLALANRHNTIRGKTINQSEFTLRYMDQFYWLVDDHTLLGRQMPIAIVGMWPERHLIEPNAYWDHGLMREYCPEAEISVLGDSDEFLMIELREKDVAQELIEAGRPAPKVLAERIITFLTPYQRDCARFELTLHSGDIAPEAATARAALGGYVGEVLSQLPAFLPSHIDHPQWNYHHPGFVEFRHKFLSERLGSLTEALPPPAFSSALDRLWWKLDGTEKRAARQRVELRDFVDRELLLLQQIMERLEYPIDLASAADREELESKLVAIRSRLASQRAALAQKLDKYFNRERLLLVGLGQMHLEQASSQPSTRHCSAGKQEELQKYSLQVNALARLYELVTEHELEIRRNQYRRMLPPRPESAVIPLVRMQELSGTEFTPRRALYRIVYRVFRNNVWRGLGLKPLVEIASSSAQKDKSCVLRVGSGRGLTDIAVDRVPGSHVWVSPSGMRTGNFAKTFANVPRFDLCVCDLDLTDLLEFSSTVAAIRPFMSAQARIVGYHFNLLATELPTDSALRIGLPGEDAIRIYRTGSEAAALLMRSLMRAKHLHQAGKYVALVVSLMRSALRIGLHPVILLARRWKIGRGEKTPFRPDLRKSVIIEIVVT